MDLPRDMVEAQLNAAAGARGHRPLSEIAREIKRDWTYPNYGAVPYLDAMMELNQITDSFFRDSAGDIVRYFLSNASTWRGEVARKTKLELKEILRRER